jgi:transposase
MAKPARSSRSGAAGTGAKSRSPRKTNPIPRVLHPDAGGADIGATHIYAAVPPDRTEHPVQVFSTFTADLYRLVAWFKEHGVTTVAMESTGVFWIPVFQILEACGIEVYLVNAKHVKNVPGRKTDVSDCQWLQYLHSVGLLRGSFRPPDAICAVRAIMRHRANLVAEGATHIRHMQKSLIQMNLHIHHVFSDLSGVSGLAIIDAILAGEQDPQVLAGLRDKRIQASEETIREALIGDYRPEHLFTLRQAREAFRFVREQMQECDVEIERYLAQLTSQIDPDETPPPPPTGKKQALRKGEIVLPVRDLRTEMYRIVGTDLTQVPGLGTTNICALVTELGVDLGSAFPKADHFCSWLGLCPNPKISGGRVLKQGTREVKHRVATIFRMAAQSLHHSDSILGVFYRRMRSKLGAPQAITATAHKLARIFYHLVTTREAYDESVFAKHEELHQKRRLERLKREAAAFGMTLSAVAEAA